MCIRIVEQVPLHSLMPYARASFSTDILWNVNRIMTPNMHHAFTHLKCKRIFLSEKYTKAKAIQANICTCFEELDTKVSVFSLHILDIHVFVSKKTQNYATKEEQNVHTYAILTWHDRQKRLEHRQICHGKHFTILHHPSNQWDEHIYACYKTLDSLCVSLLIAF